MCRHLSRLTLLLCIHIALRWSAGIDLIAFYRHIAPLERRFLSNHRDFCVSGLLKERESSSSFVCLSIFSA